MKTSTGGQSAWGTVLDALNIFLCILALERLRTRRGICILMGPVAPGEAAHEEKYMGICPLSKKGAAGLTRY